MHTKLRHHEIQRATTVKFKSNQNRLRVGAERVLRRCAVYVCTCADHVCACVCMRCVSVRACERLCALECASVRMSALVSACACLCAFVLVCVFCVCVL
jgi:hypothetical protein